MRIFNARVKEPYWKQLTWTATRKAVLAHCRFERRRKYHGRKTHTTVGMCLVLSESTATVVVGITPGLSSPISPGQSALRSSRACDGASPIVCPTPGCQNFFVCSAKSFKVGVFRFSIFLSSFFFSDGVFFSAAKKV